MGYVIETGVIAGIDQNIPNSVIGAFGWKQAMGWLSNLSACIMAFD